MSSEIVKYDLDNGQAIEVTEQDVRDLLSAGGQAAGNVTANEIKAFLRLCQAQRLNPFTKDAYIVKYGNNPATIITGKEAFTKRAYRNPKFRGMEAGVTVIGRDGRLDRREGSLILDGEKLVGGWCRVYVDGYERPMSDEVSFGEYNTGKSNWARIPATMIRKVAITHALREAFPEDLGGLYGEEEMDRTVEGQAAPKQNAAPYPEAGPAPLEVQAEVVDARPAPRPERPPRLDRLRDLFKQAKQLGIIVQDKSDPTRGLMGWVDAMYGCDVQELSDAQVAEVEAYVQGRIQDQLELQRQAEAEAEAVDAAQDLAEYDIAF